MTIVGDSDVLGLDGATFHMTKIQHEWRENDSEKNTFIIICKYIY